MIFWSLCVCQSIRRNVFRVKHCEQNIVDCLTLKAVICSFENVGNYLPIDIIQDSYLKNICSSLNIFCTLTLAS